MWLLGKSNKCTIVRHCKQNLLTNIFVDFKFVRPFGPMICKVTIPEEIIDILNEYVDKITSDKKKSSELDYGSNLAGNVDQGFKISQNQISNILRKEVTIKGIWNSNYKSKKNNWIQAEKFILNQHEFERLISHKVDLSNAAQLM